MPIMQTEMGKRLMRWMLPHEQPADLALEHPAQIDIAEAAEEIERLHSEIDCLKAIERCARDVVRECAGDMTPSLGTMARLESALYVNWKGKQK